MKPIIIGKNNKPVGISPAVILINPKYAHNVGQTIRACSCFGLKQVWFTGNRVQIDLESKTRIPREERMRGYNDVDLYQFDYPLEQFKDCAPVAIEVTANSENLLEFDHPTNAIYLFGPEDGGIPQVMRRLCYRFVTIPTYHCTNLSAAVYLVLYDRLLKMYKAGLVESPLLNEDRGWYEYGG